MNRLHPVRALFSGPSATEVFPSATPKESVPTMISPLKSLRRLLGLSALAAILLVPAPESGATTVMPANLAELTDNAGKAFVGTVTSQEVVAVGEGWGERITAEVHEAILGTTADAKVTWTQYRMGEQTRMAGMPEYEVGRTYLIFLNAPAANSPYTAPTNLGQGVFVVTSGSSGAVRARNQFNNAHLYAGLELKQLGPAAAPQRAAVKLKGGTTVGAQTELATLVAQTRALDALPGRNSLAQFGRPAREVVPLGLPGSAGADAVPTARLK
jgi:hypothetical protein